MKRELKYYLVVLFALFMAVSCEGSTEIVPPSEDYCKDKLIEFESSLANHLPTGKIHCQFIYNSEPIVVEAKHITSGGKSIFELDSFLRVGNYTLVSALYQDSEQVTKEMSIGSSIKVSPTKIVGSSLEYDDEVGLFGSGTKSKPYLIATISSLIAVDDMVNTLHLSTEGVYFKQVCDIDFSVYSYQEMGFWGVCTDPSHPFMGVYDGGGFKITNLKIFRFLDNQKDKTPEGTEFYPVGLFGNVCCAVIKNITLSSPNMIGYNWVGGVVGVVSAIAGQEGGTTVIDNCHLIAGPYDYSRKIYGNDYVGGIVGGVDEYAILQLSNCSNVSHLTLQTRGATQYGGFLGGVIGGSAANGQLYVDSCYNSANLSASSSNCVGGIVGGAHIVHIYNSINDGIIAASPGTIGVGGIIGGAGDNSIFTSVNRGKVSGGRGAGGILGSTVYNAQDEDNVGYADANIVQCHNYAEVSGVEKVGGLVGEAQSNFVGCYNSGDVSSRDSEAGGFVGVAPIVVISGGLNSGNIVGGSVVGGFVGYGEYYAMNSAVNYGDISGGSVGCGGVMGLGGTMGDINYCTNFGTINASGGKSGGIAGALGEVEATSKLDKVKLILGPIIAAGKFAFSIKGAIEKADTKMSFFRVVSIISTSVKSLQAVVGTFTPPVVEELNGWDEDVMASTDGNGQQLDEKMRSDMLSMSKNEYIGDLPLFPGITTSRIENTWQLYQTLQVDENSDTFSERSSAYLEEICEANATADKWEEVGITIGKSVLGVATLLIPGATGVVVGLVGGISISTADYFVHGGADNVIAVSGCMNFGSIPNGNGLIGQSGDRLHLANSMNAGKASMYAFADRSSARGMEIDELVSIGTAGQDPFEDRSAGHNSDYLCVMDLSNDEVDSFCSSDYMDKYNYNNYYWSYPDGGEIKIISNSCYLNFMYENLDDYVYNK